MQPETSDPSADKQQVRAAVRTTTKDTGAETDQGQSCRQGPRTNVRTGLGLRVRTSTRDVCANIDLEVGC